MSIVQYTSAGLSELISAKNQGIHGVITHIAAGDRSYTPTANQTSLVNERQRVAVASYEELSSTQLRLAAVFDGDLEYEVREVGFYLESGTLLAVYSAPSTLLTYKSVNSDWIQKFTLDISALPTNSVTVVVGTNNVNLMMTEELAVMATAQIGCMARQVAMLFRMNEIEKRLG
ncbi:phage tail protein [Marinomonas shanghaiensis]|uniref:phage tail-collar fiber domain-containing protein n=1 Tax=Marinomonas shanghaiensis TaxID=2202418 RepID=UPI003A922852